MTNKRNRATTVRFDVFGFTVHVILARDIPATGRRLHIDLTGCRAAYVTVPGDAKQGWLVLSAEPDEATVAHEASHAVRHILKEHGARNDDETFAYHLDFLVGRIHKFIRR